VDFEWDQRKASSNLRKHGVDFADAATVFEDERALTIEDDRHGEDRFVTLALDAQGRLLAVAYTLRGDRIRIISARKATRSELSHYEG